jgi:hypothetical protein
MRYVSDKPPNANSSSAAVVGKKAFFIGYYPSFSLDLTPVAEFLDGYIPDDENSKKKKKEKEEKEEDEEKEEEEVVDSVFEAGEEAKKDF